jgi:hypothetical protein
MWLRVTSHLHIVPSSTPLCLLQGSSVLCSFVWINYCKFKAQWSLYVPHSGHYTYHQFNIQQFYVLPTQCIYVFCVDLRTNSDYFTVQHWLVGFYNWDGVCLLCGTDWVYIIRVYFYLQTDSYFVLPSSFPVRNSPITSFCSAQSKDRASCQLRRNKPQVVAVRNKVSQTGCGLFLWFPNICYGELNVTAGKCV